MKRILLVFFTLLIFTSGYSQNLQISGGNSFSAAVCDNQQVFVWGANTSSQLGGTLSPAPPAAGPYTFVPVAATHRAVPGSVLGGNVDNTAAGVTYGLLPAIRQVDAGSGAHVLGLSCADQVWAWGEGGNGQLGHNALVDLAAPTRVLRGAQTAKIDPINDPNGVFLNDIFYVSGGNNSSFALEKVTGRVLAWGENGNGQLGDGSTTDRLVPVYVLKDALDGGGQLTNIVQIEGGDACTYALDANGNVWSWGLNSGNQLGRPGAANELFARRVVQGDPLNNGYSATPAPTVYLSNIIQISGGDTHCLALDASGNVWSFGGDWGQGQLGRGGGAVYQNDARKVAIPGLATYATAANQFLGSGTDGKAVYVAAGQAVSAVVMANGRVVTFGSRGMFNSNATDVAPPGTPITCPGAGGLIPSGALGDNTLGANACNYGACDKKDVVGAFSHTPVYVRNNAGTILTGITQVSDGDAWFYAIDGSGNAYTWGWNRRGELGLGAGDYSDRCAAVAFTLPAGCDFSDPCPGKPTLGADVVTCPTFSTMLNSNVPQTYASYKYTWEYRSGTTGPWTLLGAAASNNSTYSFANQLGQYRVSITDNRGTVPFLCAPCPVTIDTITYTPQPNPYTVDGCVDNSASMARFQVTGPATAKIKWYNVSTLGSPLNPLDENTTIIVPFSSTTSVPGCAVALYADDVASFPGTLRPATTVAGSPCAGAGSTETGTRSPLMIEVSQNLTLTGVSFIVPNNTNPQSATYTIKVYSHDPTGGWNCGGCTPANSNTGKPSAAALHTSTGTLISTPANSGDVVRTLTTSYALTGTSATPVKYWITVEGGDVKYLNCTPTWTTSGGLPAWTTPQVSSPVGMRALMALHDNSNAGNSHVFNITFNVGTAYNCERILVCASNTNCVLPVEFISFNATRAGSNAHLTWATASEKNSAYFIVEKSTDGITFSPIKKIDAAGNSNTLRNYSFTDVDFRPGTSYYRLAQYDIDNTLSYSEVKSLNKEGVSDIRVLPNPSNGVFNVVLEGLTGDSEITLIVRNSLSQVVYERTQSSTENTNVSLQHLAPGIYYLEVQTEDGNHIAKVVKE